jgi:hypothetical protein
MTTHTSHTHTLTHKLLALVNTRYPDFFFGVRIRNTRRPFQQFAHSRAIFSQCSVCAP